MKLLTILIGLLNRLTGLRFSKKHRINESWLYINLNTVAMNQISEGLTIKNYLKFYKY